MGYICLKQKVKMDGVPEKLIFRNYFSILDTMLEFRN